MHEARHGAGSAIIGRENDGRRTRVRELLAIQGIGEERDCVGSRAQQRADAVDYDLAVAMKLTSESRRELAQRRGHRQPLGQRDYAIARWRPA
jgi:hypothetical protein